MMVLDIRHQICVVDHLSRSGASLRLTFVGARAGRRMEDPPFDIATMLSLEFHDHKEWAEVLVAANILALEMDSLLVRAIFNGQ